MNESEPIIDWPPADSDEFVQMLCVFAEHLSVDEMRRGTLRQIRVHGRPMVEQLNRLILAERIHDASARATVVSAIGWTGQGESATAIRAALGDQSDQVLRAGARAAWFDLRDRRMIPRLLELLHDSSVEPDTAVAAAESLARFRALEALPRMVHLAAHRNSGLDEEERRQMIDAIERLARIDLGDPDLMTASQRLRRLRSWWRDMCAQTDSPEDNQR